MPEYGLVYVARGSKAEDWELKKRPQGTSFSLFTNIPYAG